MAEQEQRVNLLFRNIEDEFNALERLDDPSRAESKLRTITGMLRDCKAVIKEYEREARVDGLPAQEVLTTKQRYVTQVNTFVRRKKAADTAIRARAAAQQGVAPSSAGYEEPATASHDARPKQVQDMNNQEIIQLGRDKMDSTDAELAAGRRVVAQTEETAVKTAAQLKKQTEQLNTVAADLNEIEFTAQRAGKVIRDITRGLATDKCIMCLIFLVALAIIAAIVVKVLDLGGDNIDLPGPEDDDEQETPENGGRKLLRALLRGPS